MTCHHSFCTTNAYCVCYSQSGCTHCIFLYIFQTCQQIASYSHSACSYCTVHSFLVKANVTIFQLYNSRTDLVDAMMFSFLISRLWFTFACVRHNLFCLYSSMYCNMYNLSLSSQDTSMALCFFLLAPCVKVITESLKVLFPHVIHYFFFVSLD